MTKIHPAAIVHENAILGDGCEVGPFAVVEAGVRIGDHTYVAPHAIIKTNVTMGSNCQVDSFAVVGGSPQHLKYSGEPTRVEIGDGVVLREYVTVHRGTEQGGGLTTIGDNAYVMAYSHIAHDCHVGQGVILANAIQLAGHVTIGEMTVLGGHSAIAQFCRVGAHCYIGGGTVIRKDVPPFVTGKGSDIEIQGINAVGLLRRGFSKETVRALKDVYRMFYMQNLTTAQALEKAVEFSDNNEVRSFIEFSEFKNRRLQMKVSVGVVGLGKMGSFHLGKLLEHPLVDVTGIFDTDPVRSHAITSTYGVHAFGSLEDLLFESDAIVVATSTASHFSVVRSALEAGVHALVEKPLTGVLQNSRELTGLAEDMKLVLQVGFLERFRLHSLLGSSEIPYASWMLAERESSGPIRDSSVDVCSDLMIHDIDLVLSLKRDNPVRVSARGAAVVSPTWDRAVAQLEFADGSLATLSANRVSRKTTRLLSFGDSGSSYELDLAANHGTLRTEDSIVELRHQQTHFDALEAQTNNFVEAVLGVSRSKVSGAQALQSEYCLQLILESLSQTCPTPHSSNLSAGLSREHE